MPFIGDKKKKTQTTTGIPQAQKPAAVASEGLSLKSSFAQEALRRAQEAAKTQNYGFKQDERGVVTRTQTESQKAAMLAKELSTLNENQRATLDRLVSQNAAYVESTSGNYGTDTAIFKYAEALKDPNHSLSVSSKYGFNPHDSNGNLDNDAMQTYSKLSTKDQLALDVSKTGNVSAPNGNEEQDPDGWNAWRKYKQALNQNDYWGKETGKQVEYSEKTAAKRNANTSIQNEMDNLARTHSQEFGYDVGDDAEALSEKYKDAGLSASAIKKLWQDDYSQRYAGMDASQIAELDAQKRVTLQQKAREAKAAIAEKYTPKDNTGSHDPSKNYASTQTTLEDIPKDVQKEIDKIFLKRGLGIATAADNIKYDELMEKYPNRAEKIEKGNPANVVANGAKDWFSQYSNPNVDNAEDFSPDNTKAQNYAAVAKNLAGNVGNDAKYIVNQTIQGIGDVVGGFASVAAYAHGNNIKNIQNGVVRYAMGESIANQLGVKEWSLQDVRSRFGTIDTLMSIGETSGSGRYNTYNQAGYEEASGLARFVGSGLRSAISSLIYGQIGGELLAETIPAAGAVGKAATDATNSVLQTNGASVSINIANALSKSHPVASKVASALLPEVHVGVESVPFLMGAWGNGYQEAIGNGYNEKDAAVWGSCCVVTEGLPEAMSWSNTYDTFSEKRISNIMNQINGGVDAKTALDGLRKIRDTRGTATILSLLNSVNSEGMEEISSNYLEYAARKVVMNENAELPTAKENWDAYAGGAFAGLLGTAVSKYANGKSGKVANEILDTVDNGQKVTTEQTARLINAVADDEAKTPVSNEQLSNAVDKGLPINTELQQKYEDVNNRVDTANKRTADAKNKLSQLIAAGDFSEKRSAALKEYTESVKDRQDILNERANIHSELIKNVGEIDAKATEQAQKIEAEEQKKQSEYTQWQYNQAIANDPESAVSVLDGQANSLQNQRDALYADLSQNGTTYTEERRQAVKDAITTLDNNISELSNYRAQAVQAIAEYDQQGAQKIALTGEVEALKRKLATSTAPNKVKQLTYKISELQNQIALIDAAASGNSEADVPANAESVQQETSPEPQNATVEPQNVESATSTPVENKSVETPVEAVTAEEAKLRADAREMIDSIVNDPDDPTSLESLKASFEKDLQGTDVNDPSMKATRFMLDEVNSRLADASAESGSVEQNILIDTASNYSESSLNDDVENLRSLYSNGNEAEADAYGLEMAERLLEKSDNHVVDSRSEYEPLLSHLRSIGIKPTASQRAEAASLIGGNYNDYRKAVWGVTHLLGENASGIPIDIAAGEAEAMFPGLAGDASSPVEWLLDLATKVKGDGLVKYNGNIDVDSRNLWEKLKTQYGDAFHQSPTRPAGLPDFKSSAAKYGKAAAEGWVNERKAAGDDIEKVKSYAEKRSAITTSGREKAFFKNVIDAIDGKKTAKVGGKIKDKAAFIRAAEAAVAEDVQHYALDSQVYTDTAGIGMLYEAPKQGTPVRKLMQVKQDFINVLDVAYTDEHFSSKMRHAGATAYYDYGNRFVSSESNAGVDEFLHEMGHSLTLEVNKRNSAAQADIETFGALMPPAAWEGYDTSKPEIKNAEASAELFRAWVMNPAKMEKTYPDAIAAIREKLGNKRFKKLESYSNSMRAYVGADHVTKMDSTMMKQSDEKALRRQQKSMKDRYYDVTQKLFDKQAGFRKFDRAMGKSNATDETLTQHAGQIRRTSAILDSLWEDGIRMTTTDGNGKQQSTQIMVGLSDVLKGKVTEKNRKIFNTYLEDMRALDRYNVNKNDWILDRDRGTPATVRAELDKISGSNPEVVEAANNFYQWNRAFMDVYAKPMLGEKAIENLFKANPHYIPQTRVFQNDTTHDNTGGGGTNGAENGGIRGIKTGSGRALADPLEAYFGAMNRIVQASLVNDALNVAAMDYDGDSKGAASQFLHEIDGSVKSVDISRKKESITKRIEKAWKNEGTAHIDMETATTLDQILDDELGDFVYAANQKPNGRGNVITILDNGTKRYFEVTDMNFLDAIMSAPPQDVDIVLKMSKSVGQTVSRLITSDNPAFALGNASRDFGEALITGSHGDPVTLLRDVVTSLNDIRTNSDTYKEYKAYGGGGGLSSIYVTPSQIKELENLMGSKDIGAIKRSLEKVFGGIESFNNALESMTRLAEYKNVRRKGGTILQAQYAAQNGTTDFSLGGSGTRVMRGLFRFVTPALQSTYKAINTVADVASGQKVDAKKLGSTLVKGAVYGVLARAILTAFNRMNDDDEQYEALPEYTKSKYWIFRMGGDNSTGKFIRIPVANGAYMTLVSTVGDSIGNAIADALQGKQIDVGSSIASIATDVANSMNPFGEINKGNPLGSNFVWNLPIQLLSNTSWTGADIVPSYMADLSPELQYNNNTTSYAKWVGKVLGISPMKVDYAVSQNSGVLGELGESIYKGISDGQETSAQYGAAAGTAAGVGSGLREFFLSRFYADTAYSNQTINSYYDLKSTLDNIVTDVGSTTKQGEPYTPILKNLDPAQTAAAANEAKAISNRCKDVNKILTDMRNQANALDENGQNDEARKIRLQMQQQCAEATKAMVDYLDKWKSIK